MAFRRIETTTWPRRPHFEHFEKMDHPWLDICVPVDATVPWLICRAEAGPSFFAASLFLAIRAVNSVPELRTRVRNDEIIIHERVDVGSTIPRDDETFGFGFMPARGGFRTFAAATTAEVERVRVQRNELVDSGRDDVIHFSVAPWLAFTAVGHPRHRYPADSIPKIVIGRCHQLESRWMLPVACSVHHGLVDGLHLGRFFEGFQNACDGAENILKT